MNVATRLTRPNVIAAVLNVHSCSDPHDDHYRPDADNVNTGRLVP